APAPRGRVAGHHWDAGVDERRGVGDGGATIGADRLAWRRFDLGGGPYFLGGGRFRVRGHVCWPPRNSRVSSSTWAVVSGGAAATTISMYLASRDAARSRRASTVRGASEPWCRVSPATRARCSAGGANMLVLRWAEETAPPVK